MNRIQQSWRSLVTLIVFLGIALAMLGSLRWNATATSRAEGATAAAIAMPTSAIQAIQLTYLPTVTTSGARGTTTGEWSQLGGNPQRTNFVEATLPARLGALNQDWHVLWVWNGPAGQDTGPAAGHLSLPDAMTPVAGDGRLYVGHSDGVVRAISTATGAQLWAATVGGELINAGAYDSATGAVFFASTDGKLYKLRASDGAALGNFNAGAAIEQAVLLVGETVYIGTRGGKLYAVNTTTMGQRWVSNAGAPITASAAYASKAGGLIIFPSEDGQVHAVRAATGTQAWHVPVNTFMRPAYPNRPARFFPDVYAVVAEAADVVIIRSYFDWNKTWVDAAGTPESQTIVRQFLESNPTYESFFVLDLDDGARRFTAPVLGGAIGNGGHYYSSPPQAVVRRLPNGSDVAYVLWRNRTACRLPAGSCDGREDTTIGEMDLTTGVIRFVQDHKNEGTIRLPTDEQGALSMVGNVLFHSHWMSLGALRVPNRETGGASITSPIPSEEYLSVTNTLGQGQCAQRNSATHYCPVGHSPVDDSYRLDPGFYIYYYDQNAYDQFWHPPVRGPIYDRGVLYWRSNDGAVIALAPA